MTLRSDRARAARSSSTAITSASASVNVAVGYRPFLSIVDAGGDDPVVVGELHARQVGARLGGHEEAVAGVHVGAEPAAAPRCTRPWRGRRRRSDLRHARSRLALDAARAGDPPGRDQELERGGVVEDGRAVLLDLAAQEAQVVGRRTGERPLTGAAGERVGCLGRAAAVVRGPGPARALVAPALDESRTVPGLVQDVVGPVTVREIGALLLARGDLLVATRGVRRDQPVPDATSPRRRSAPSPCRPGPRSRPARSRRSRTRSRPGRRRSPGRRRAGAGGRPSPRRGSGGERAAGRCGARKKARPWSRFRGGATRSRVHSSRRWGRRRGAVGSCQAGRQQQLGAAARSARCVGSVCMEQTLIELD